MSDSTAGLSLPWPLAFAKESMGPIWTSDSLMVSKWDFPLLLAYQEPAFRGDTRGVKGNCRYLFTTLADSIAFFVDDYIGSLAEEQAWPW